VTVNVPLFVKMCAV
jgi:hypothetical protein